FFVTPGQIGYWVDGPPTLCVQFPNLPQCQAAITILAKDGTVSRGLVNVSQSTPSIFTRTANGLGAPAAVASANGQTFNILMSNADGTAVPIDAGNFVMLFGTGLRYGSTATTVTIGGTAVT